MKQRQLGKSGPKVSAMGLGCMGMSSFYGPTDEKSAIDVIHRAFAEGITLFDTADMYGNGANELLLGKAVKNFRNKAIIATKCGIELKGMELKVHNSPEYIEKSCHESLQRLGMETIDVYFLHRYNSEVPLEDSMKAMLDLIKEGKVRFVGLSEVEGSTLEKAQCILGDKLVALQSEYSILNHSAPAPVLPICRKLNISFVAHAPLGRGLLTGKFKDPAAFSQSGAFDVRSVSPQFQGDAFKNNLRLVEALADIAKQKHCTLAQLALAWVLALGEDVIPIPGTKQMKYLLENLGALNIELSQADLSAIDNAIEENPVHGMRLI